LPQLEISKTIIQILWSERIQKLENLKQIVNSLFDELGISDRKEFGEIAKQ
jgi:hypothetical protein